jgi:hypothetical protein
MPLETKTEGGSGTNGSATTDFGLDPAPGCGRASGENKSTRTITAKQRAAPLNQTQPAGWRRAVAVRFCGMSLPVIKLLCPLADPNLSRRGGSGP